jgi:hypothetical protein
MRTGRGNVEGSLELSDVRREARRKTEHHLPDDA